MKIGKQKAGDQTIQDADYGDCFYYQSLLYMKVVRCPELFTKPDLWPAVNVQSGGVFWFSDKQPVRLVDVTANVEDFK